MKPAPSRYICIHGHFYQPPRENPWLEEVEVQDAAAPFHDWNELITAECYGPNTAARILREDGRIIDIINNYQYISFNFGPTLMTWLQRHAPNIYQAILEADRLSQNNFSGHGNALAQVYNHLIMPLANRRDKQTQVFWGIKDFEHRYGRRPEGMWLPETAVDRKSLEVLVDHGIKFTILAQHQAHRIRPLGGTEGDWLDVSGGQIDPSQPYRVVLDPNPNNPKYIDIFFYNETIARAVAFEGLLSSGEHLTTRLLGGFSDDRQGPQLVHIATDGESYGHHHHFGEMALAYAIERLRSNNECQLINYGQFLEEYPPTWEVEVYDNSSWSCPHGVERWQADCGCNSGGHPGWNQAWRAPLRAALDWLRNELSVLFETRGGQYLRDPWEARNQYISVILDRGLDNLDKFLNQHQKYPLKYFERRDTLKLLEMQRHALLMYTSCAWFFDEISGEETVQNLKYAARALQLARSFTGEDLEEEFLRRLSWAPSNISEFGNGARVYRCLVMPALVDLRRIIAQYAISSIFEEKPERSQIYCFDLEHRDYRQETYGGTALAVGRVMVISQITMSAEELTFVVLYLGGHDFHCVLRTTRGIMEYEQLKKELFQIFSFHSLTEVIRYLDNNFGTNYYSLKDLLTEERRKLIFQIIAETFARFENTYRQQYEENRKLMEYLKDIETPIPRPFLVAAEYTLTQDLEREITDLEETPDLERIASLVEEIRRWNLRVEAERLEPQFRRTLEKSLDCALRSLDQPEKLEKVLQMLKIAHVLPFPVNFWGAQNRFYQFWQEEGRQLKESAAGEEITTGILDLDILLGIADQLNFALK
ncbi:MAG: DUF3536 domain-containing protein [Deltaproteobacteria bacterium]|nr:DUF3536 domain-containing protein [Deltaproteobacteria bacterium]